jgi:hypothetical protein
MKELKEHELEEMNKAFLSLRSKKIEISAKDFSKAMRWKLDETVEALKAIFNDPEKYKTIFYVLLSPDNRFFLR